MCKQQRIKTTDKVKVRLTTLFKIHVCYNYCVYEINKIKNTPRITTILRF